MFYLLILLFVLSDASRILKYNTPYAISKPHYMTKTTPMIYFKDKVLPDYEIPKWVYKKVFKYNKPNKYNS